MSDTVAISGAANATSDSIRVERDVCLFCSRNGAREFLRAPDRFHLRTEIYQLLRCSSCGCVWLVDPPEPARMGEHYTKDYHRGIMAAGEGLDRWDDTRKRIARYKQGGAILDIGCSSGGFLSTMSGSSWQRYGIEMEESTAAKARQQAGAEVFVGDAVQAPFLPESFDVITCFDVLEHVYSPHEFLSKVFEWLKPGGIFYAMMPNIDSWEARLFGSYWYGLELPRHLFHFSPQSIRALMPTLGFQEVALNTPRASYIERSLGYVGSRVLQTFGFNPAPQSSFQHRSIPSRVARKAMRLAIIAPISAIASAAGRGPSMEIVFSAKQHLETFREQGKAL
jgi:SAM-dependent methyltransferase